MDFASDIEKSTAHRPIRDRISADILSGKYEFGDLFRYASDVNWHSHTKACWIMELVLEADLELIRPHLETFCNNLKKYREDGALRSISKICLFICRKHYAKNTARFAERKQLERIAESCFDWLISGGKVAMKAYAMRALLLLGKDFDWIHEELETVVEKGFADHSAAYQSAARDILKKLKR